MIALSDFLFLQWTPYHAEHLLSMDFWICLSTVFYAWVVQRNGRKILNLCQHLFSFRETARSKTQRASKGVLRRFWNFSFLAISFIAVSWMIYVLWMYTGWHFSFDRHHEVHWGCNYLLLVCAAFTVLFYMAKGLLIPFLARMFDEKGFGIFLWRMGLSHDFLLSVFTFPLAILFLYAGKPMQIVFFWMMVFITVILFIVKLLKATLVGRYYSRFSYLHIFVYFCGLEILLPFCLWQIVFGL